MSTKIDAAENMFNGVKSYNELNSLEKTARHYGQRRRCKGCSYGGLCPNKVLVVCIQSYEKGFIAGVKHHRKVVKYKRNENNIIQT